MKKLGFLLLCLTAAELTAQSINTPLEKVDRSGKYLFYVHSGLITELGNNAINQGAPQWGPYQYLSILDSLSKRNFHVLSDRRIKGVEDSIYVEKMAGQIDTLLNAGISPRNIVVVAVSSGWDLVAQVSAKVKLESIKFVKMGGCWPDTYKDFTNTALYGDFLSIIEATDPHGTCISLFAGRKNLTYREMTLRTGLSHGFMYKGHKEWIDPLVEWFEK